MTHTARMEHNSERLAVSPREAAEMIGVSLRTIQNYIKAKQLPARKLGRRTVVEVSQLKAFIRSDRASAGAAGAPRPDSEQSKGIIPASEER